MTDVVLFFEKEFQNTKESNEKLLELKVAIYQGNFNVTKIPGGGRGHIWGAQPPLKTAVNDRGKSFSPLYLSTFTGIFGQGV